MGKRESHEPGTFSWAELVTSDDDGAKAFYAALFGWDYDDQPLPDDQGVYVMVQQGDATVAALYESSDQPPHWNSYITVEDADAAAEKAAELGGTVTAGPFDVMESGRMAFISDPQGALFAVWEPKEHIGAGLVNAHGALSWNDLATTDVGAAKEFYGELFGWEFGEVEGAPGDRAAIKAGETLNGGIAALPEESGETPPHWLVYFAVDDLDAALSTVDDEGGKVLVDPLEVPAGKFAIITDPQGAPLAIFSGQLDD